ncbi:ABC-type Fe3+/spermidine/putrescine transport systems, ATPase components [Chitinophaga sp. YR627]|uniref:ABC transporter ATP-binding protein n=1 Tax=Chitinophaga sp. YR627 TaxID=1881041 RepID=UPI0008E062C4|nr:ABC transporter ATP-binding protein [Chitinophaga sp. YR627]SFN31332.1 ABC-type Fe3+/spermidine/putrescine transport systems, ATPase components [Chitinophaga sp. YR627]
MNLLEVTDVRKQEGEEEVLKGVSFTQKAFQKVAIVGESGSGKSTLLKIVGGLTQSDGGEVRFEDVKVKGPLERLLPGQPGIAYLSQHYELRNHYRMEEILAYANMLADEDAERLYKICRIDHLMKRKNDQLSGGEKQRVALARLLTTAPRLLILDEPYSNLDPILKNTLKAVIREISEDLNITCLLVSHDPVDTLSWADEVIVMKDGQIVQQGAPEVVYHQPVNEYVAALFGSYNMIPSAQATDFSKVSGLHLNGKSLFIRPERFRIVEKGQHGLSGKIKDVSFMGSSYEVAVELPAATITVKTDNNDLRKGEDIYLSLSPTDVWYA